MLLGVSSNSCVGVRGKNVTKDGIGMVVYREGMVSEGRRIGCIGKGWLWWLQFALVFSSVEGGGLFV